MKMKWFLLVLLVLINNTLLIAQKGTFSSELAPLTDMELQKLATISEYIIPQTDVSTVLPSSVDNSQLSYFRPLFNQSGLECGQAASIGLNFTYEVNLLRNVPGNISQNQYATHFTYNFINGGSDAGVSYFETWEIVKRLGTPTVFDYGGLATGGASRWMTGYDKYYNAMHNRILDVYTIKAANEEGLATLKGWLYNHNGASTIGGLANIYIQYKVPDAQLAAGTPEAGKWAITTWGGSPNHAITLVGYNDSVRYDYNNDGQYTNSIDINGDGMVNMKDWEIGAFKIANTYGGINNWGNQGFCYVMYKTFADNLGSGGIWNHAAHIIKVKQDVVPKLTFKVKIKHTSRNKIKIMAGVAQSTTATEPDMLLPLPVFDYQGGDKYMTGGTNEADKTIELGIDATPLLSSVTSGLPAKYFLIVDEDDPGSAASGEIVTFSLMSYNPSPVEIPCPNSNVPLQDNNTTTLSVVASMDYSLPQITTSSLPEAKIYEPYSYQLTSTGGTPQHAWKFMCDYSETNSSVTFPSVTASQLTITNSSSGFAEVNLPFEFPFYGKKYSKLYAHVDGYLMFEPDLFPWTFIIYEKTFFKNTKNISPYMAKPLTLFPAEGDGIWYQVDADGIIFRWKIGMYGSGPATDLNFAVKLFPSGKIEFYYGSIVSNSWVKWNAGISNGDGVNFKTLSITEVVPQPSANTLYTLTSLPFPTELSISDNGVLSGTPAQAYQNIPLKFYVQDNNNLFTTKTLNFNTKGLLIQYLINSGGDSILEYGETANLTATIKNISSSTQNNVNLKFTANSTYVTVIDSLQSFASLAPGETKTVANAIQFFIDNQVPDGSEIPTVSLMTTSDDIYTRNLPMDVYAPDVKVAELTITDGNNNVLMPGETANLALLIKNMGGSSASNILLNLQAIDPHISITQSSASIPFLDKQATQLINFSVSISPLCPQMHVSLANLIISADKDYSAIDSVFFNVGIIAEDFETGNFLKYPWQLAGNAQWIVSNSAPYEGLYAASSPTLADNQSSSMLLTMHVLSQSQISFYYKVSSEANYDFLRFYIDGVEQGRWSGEVGWTKATYPVSKGIHTFSWSYSKDNSVVAGSDKAWVDFIVWPPEDNYLFLANAGVDDFMCSPSEYNLNPILINAESSFWTTSGDGYFDNPSDPTATYFAGPTDIINGVVELTIHAMHSGLNTITDAVSITVLKKATASCGTDAFVCQHSPFQNMLATAADYISLNWVTSGDGTFDNPTAIHPIYYPGNMDKLNGSVWLILNATGVSQCAIAVDSLKLTIHPFINANAGADQMIDFGTFTQLQGSASGSNSLSFHWEPADKVITPNLAVTYTINLESDQSFVLKATDNLTACFSFDTTLIQVLNAPLGAEIVASPDTICRNQTSQLEVLAVGGSGIYTYTWTSSPPGFTSDIANPVVQPQVTTQYFVVVFDGLIAIENSIVVQVDTTLPIAPQKPTGPTVVNVLLSTGSSYMTNTNSSYAGFDWVLSPANAGTLEPTGEECIIHWNPTFSGNVELSVGAYNSCGTGTYSPILQIFASPTVDKPKFDFAELVFWPNPASNTLYIRNIFSLNKEFLIMNSLGSAVLRGNLVSQSDYSMIDISLLQPGCYTLHCVNGDSMVVLKFVKL